MTNVRRRSHPDYPMYEITEHGRVWSLYTNKYLKPKHDRKGYAEVNLYCEPGKVVMRKVHQLVLEVFDRYREDGEETRHLDGNPRNNWIHNLRWGTTAENRADTVKHGRRPGARPKFGIREATELRLRYEHDGETLMGLSADTGASYTAVRNAIMRSRQAHPIRIEEPGE